LIITKVSVTSVAQLKNHIFLLKCNSSRLSSEFKAGQFANIKVSESSFPLLRRPFSICDIDQDNICFMFTVHGEGTRNLSDKKQGDLIDVIAPLGKGFGIDEDFDHAIIIAGGIGVAPFPLLTKRLAGKKVTTFLGGRSTNDIVTYGLENVKIATDDGSMGVKGNVVDLFATHLDELRDEKMKVFACGPTPMLRVLQQLLLRENINGEISTECAMACGFGICQGCPVENSHDETKYLLVCKDGPVFNVKDVVL